MPQKTFPIFSSIADGFKAFRPHWMFLACAGAVVGSIQLFDAYLVPVGSGKFFQDLQFIAHDIVNGQNTQKFFAYIEALYNFFRNHPEPFCYYGYALLFLALHIFLMFGLIRICFALVEKKKVSLLVFLSDIHQYLRLLGASVLSAVLFILVEIILIALAVGSASRVCTLICVCVAVFVLFGAMIYSMLVPLCAADKPKSVFEIMSCSVNLMRGNVMRFFAFELILMLLRTLFGMLLVILLGGLLGGFLGGACFMLTVSFPSPDVFNVIPQFLAGTILTPLALMIWVSAYKHLK